MDRDKRPVILGITGATGAVYAVETVRALTELNIPLVAVLTGSARQVMTLETGREWEEWCAALDPQGALITTGPLGELHHPVASGSFPVRGMAVVPCSMGSLGRIAGGISSNLLERAADVCLKERRRLVLMTRETPLNRIHLQNMLTLTDAGAIVFPPVPAFYNNPRSLDDMVRATVSRLLDLLDIPQERAPRWRGLPREE